MSKKMMYSYKGQIVALTDEEVNKSLLEIETRSRSGKFNYVNLKACQAQIEQMKTTWHEDAKLFLRTKVKELMGSQPMGTELSAIAIQKGIVEACRTIFAVKRAKRNNSDPKAEFAYMSGDIALSFLFKIMPDISLENASRKFGANGKIFRVKTSSNPKQLVIDEEKLNEADMYVQALYRKDENCSVLIGWATQDQMRAAPKDNRSTNESCGWTKMAYHIPIENLRPMSEFVTACSLTEIPTGILFESVPQLKDIPLLASAEAQSMANNSGDSAKKQTYEEFLAECGFDMTATGGATTTVAKEEGLSL